MRLIVTDVTRSVVCVSVCMFGHSDVGLLRKNGWTARDVFGADYCRSKESCIRWA